MTMCTVSWWRKNWDYGVLFNRDESRKRLEADPPATRQREGCRYISPIDRDAGGTWIWVNEHGVTACILNNYPHHHVSVSNPVSRGLLLNSLACLKLAGGLGGALGKHDLRQYRAFFILAFDERCTKQVCWDGETLLSLHDSEVHCPLTTSGFKPAEVISYRDELFERRFASRPELSHEELARFQSEHDAGMPAHSVLMAREDARTVSQSHVQVTKRSVSFGYYSVSGAQRLEPVNNTTLNRA
jgi:hypothetical protein